MGDLRRGVHDVHDFNRGSLKKNSIPPVVQPVEEISGEKQQDFEFQQFKGYAPITRFSQDKPPRKGFNFKILGSIILVLIVAVVLVIIFSNKNSISEIGIGQQNLGMQIKNVQIENDSAKVNLEIDPKNKNITGIKFIFETEEGIEEFTENISITEFTEMEFTFELRNVNSSNIKKISVVPILLMVNEENSEETEEVVGRVKDTYSPKKRDYQALINNAEYHLDYTPDNSSGYGNFSEKETTIQDNYTSNTELENNISSTQRDVNYTNQTGTNINNIITNVTNQTLSNNTLIQNITNITNQIINYTNQTLANLSNKIYYKEICEGKGGVWIEYSYQAYCHLPIGTSIESN